MTEEQTKFLYSIADNMGTTGIEDFTCKDGEKMREIIKALEKQPTTQEILSHIETGITATGQSDSYCVGFCNALIWLKACITHEEPQFFEDGKVKIMAKTDEVIRKTLIKETYGIETITIDGCILVPFYQVEDKLKKFKKIEQIVSDYGLTNVNLLSDDLTDFEKDILREILELE